MATYEGYVSTKLLTKKDTLKIKSVLFAQKSSNLLSFCFSGYQRWQFFYTFAIRLFITLKIIYKNENCDCWNKRGRRPGITPRA